MTNVFLNMLMRHGNIHYVTPKTPFLYEKIIFVQYELLLDYKSISI